MTDEFEDITRDIVASAPATMFGFVLEEVEAFGKTLQDIDAKVEAQSKVVSGHAFLLTKLGSSRTSKASMIAFGLK